MLPSSISPPRTDRIALVLVQAGAIAVVLASLPYKPFDLDRYFVPKELVLHVAAAGAALCCLVPRSRLSFARIDWLLIGYIALSAVSALFADNHWLSTRSLAITLSGAALFWIGRVLRRDGLSRPVLWALGLAGAIGAGTALLQAYGVTSEYFSLNRSPGGTFGNRNFMAHLSAIVAPTIIYCGVTTRRSVATLVSGILIAVIAAAEVLSRSRAAWLALLAAAVPLAIVAWMTRARWSGRETSQRLVMLAIATVVGIIVALVLPNTLEWNSKSPYLESVRGMVNYQEGSGRGRLVQYTNSLRIMAANPLLGVGPGNWGVEYPRYAQHGDASLSSVDEGMTSNPWPSSDWVAFAAERGAPATVLLVLIFVAFLGLAAWHMRVARGTEGVLSALVLAGTVIITLVVGAFDAVLLTAPPTFFVWLLLGVYSEPVSSSAPRQTMSTGVRRWGPLVVFGLGLLAAGRSAFQMAAMATVTESSRTSALERASLFDPGSYRIHMRLAEAYLNNGRCDRARPQARDARDLYPTAILPRDLLSQCGESSPRPRRQR
ncbi:MAG TPA: O-antigen ligase family protein [Gemmatimonadaceae bacterium]|nr:O-antigen ligase family protein [Gemmatimonadaceae bacterium]